MTLPDVNVWLAWSLARHPHNSVAAAFFQETQDELGFCRITQMGFVRLLTNPAAAGTDAITQRQAWDLYFWLMADPRMRFVPEPDGLEAVWRIFSTRYDRSHSFWTDDYLAAFAQAANVELVTLDRGLRKRYPSVGVTCLL